MHVRLAHKEMGESNKYYIITNFSILQPTECLVKITQITPNAIQILEKKTIKTANLN